VPWIERASVLRLPRRRRQVRRVPDSRQRAAGRHRRRL